VPLRWCHQKFAGNLPFRADNGLPFPNLVREGLPTTGNYRVAARIMCGERPASSRASDETLADFLKEILGIGTRLFHHRRTAAMFEFHLME